MSTSPHPRPQELDMLHDVARSRVGRRRLPRSPLRSECTASLSICATLGREPESRWRWSSRYALLVGSRNYEQEECCEVVRYGSWS
jgi:hypothetical protein